MAQTTTYLKTEREFAQLHPDHAIADAQQDIKEKTVKLFYQDRSEYPEILGIDQDFTRALPHVHISIGQGCLDPINDDSCPLSYRESYHQALLYGRLYNQTIASHFESNSTQREKIDSAPQVANQTADFLGQSSERARIVIELSDIHPLFGGRNISVNGEGDAQLQILLSSNSKSDSFEYTVKLEPEDIQSLIAAFVDNDFVTLELDENPQLDPDTARPTLILRNANGETHRLTGWVIHLPPASASHSVRSPIQRFDSIYKEMLRIERRIQDGQDQQPTIVNQEE